MGVEGRQQGEAEKEENVGVDEKGGECHDGLLQMVSRPGGD